MKKEKTYEKYFKSDIYLSTEELKDYYNSKYNLYNYLNDKFLKKRKINLFLGITRKKNGSTRRSKT